MSATPGVMLTLRVGDAAVVATPDGDVRIECVRTRPGRVGIRITAPRSCPISRDARDERPPRE